MNRTNIDYKDLNARAKENHLFAKLSGQLADYGYNCLRLSNDFNGADFIAVREGERDELYVQLKSRVTIAKKYQGKGLYIAFPIDGDWYVLEHDTLVEISGELGYLDSKSWTDGGSYSTGAPSAALKQLLLQYRL